MLWALAIVPLVGGGAVWLADARRRAPGRRVHGRRVHGRRVHGRRVHGRRVHGRRGLGVAALAVLAVTGALAAWAAASLPSAAYRFGAGIDLRVRVDGVAAVGAVLVVAMTSLVIVYAAAHEPRPEDDPSALGRLLGLMTAFAGAMELLVIADDLLTLLIAWELVGAFSWALIAWNWRSDGKPAAAAHAFNATRFGDLGLFLAAGAALAGAGSFAYADLAALDGSALHVMVGGVLLAAAAKSGQVLFAPWLFSAMEGPTSVSALLHSSTMVAAGAYLLVRLHAVLDSAAWFGGAAIAIGLSTALAGGVVALLQTHAKKLLAASTSAHYGLMFVAAGAGYPVVALGHLVVHAVFKAHLFLSAGVAMEAVGGPQLGRMRLGRALPTTAWLSLASALALAGLAPLGGAWSKDQVVAAAGHEAPWLAVLVLVAGGLSAVYATRFQVLAFGPMSTPAPGTITARPGPAEIVAMGMLAAVSVGLGLLWVPGVEELASRVVPGLGGWPPGATWEVVASVAIAVAAIYGTWTADRRGRLGSVGSAGRARAAADWLGVPTAVETVVVRPTLALASAASAFDDRVVDAGVRSVAALGRRTSSVLARGDEVVVDAGVRAVAAFGRWWSWVLSQIAERGVNGAVSTLVAGVASAARDSRRLQTGMAHQYYVVISAGLVVIVAVAAFGR